MIPAEQIEIEIDTTTGPRVTYGALVDPKEIDAAAAEHGYTVDYTSQIKIGPQTYRAPLVK